MKRFILLMAMLVLLPYCVRAEPVSVAEVWPPCYMTVALGDHQLLNVRKQPEKSASAWGTLRGGEDVYVTAIDGAWATVDYGKETGYVQLRYVEITANTACTVTSNGRVRLRERPGGKLCGFLQDGQTVMALAWQFDDENALWARTATGYVMAEYLDVAEDNEEQEGEPYGE